MRVNKEVENSTARNNKGRKIGDKKEMMDTVYRNSAAAEEKRKKEKLIAKACDKDLKSVVHQYIACFGTKYQK